MMDYRAGNGNEDMKYLMQQHHPHHTPWDVNPWAQVRKCEKMTSYTCHLINVFLGTYHFKENNILNVHS